MPRWQWHLLRGVYEKTAWLTYSPQARLPRRGVLRDWPSQGSTDTCHPGYMVELHKMRALGTIPFPIIR